MLGKLYRIYLSKGLPVLGYAIKARLQSRFAGRARSFTACASNFLGKRGLEVGGPSRSFTARGIFPVYPIAGSLDNCTFGSETVWEGSIQEGRHFQYCPGKPAGKQFISEATCLRHVESAAYDFVLASHVLEHVANPILALQEWGRVLRGSGLLVLLLPDKLQTFDHHRPVTLLSHLIEDFRLGRGEDDLTHLPEILAMHDLDRDPESGDVASFRLRSEQNHRFRCLHHHVFDMPLAQAAVEYVGLEVVAAERMLPHHLLLLARKP